MLNSFKDLEVWQRSMELVKLIYALTQKLPQSEQFSLASQIRRAAISIPSNIAEGSKRGTRKDYIQFLRIALGSSAEVETQLLLMKDLYPGIITTKAESILTEIQKMLTVLVRRLLSKT